MAKMYLIRIVEDSDIHPLLREGKVFLCQDLQDDDKDPDLCSMKVYNEVFTQYAMLRQADAQAANVDTIRVKVQKTSDGATLPGYTFTQESHDF